MHIKELLHRSTDKNTFVSANIRYVMVRKNIATRSHWEPSWLPVVFSHIHMICLVSVNETIALLAKALPSRTCLIMGSATKDYPFVINTPSLSYAAGSTKNDKQGF